MHFIRCLIAGSALLATTLLAGSALASDNKIALIPGGPHPYFKPWEQAAADAKKDFGIASVDFKVPTDWKLSLQTELIESLVAVLNAERIHELHQHFLHRLFLILRELAER